MDISRHRGLLRLTALVLTFLLAAVAISELHLWRFEGAERAKVASNGAETTRFFDSSGYRELPVVAPNAGTLLATVYYAFPDRAERFVYLETEHSPGDSDQSDTTDKGLQPVRKYWPARVEKIRPFLAAEASFLVYTEGPDIGRDRSS